MDNSFKIPVYYKGEQEFDAKLVPYGYTHRFIVDIQGIQVYFEPDEERQYRAILSNEAIEKNLIPDVELIKLLAEKINELAAQKRT